jgi:hypothetical protein
VNVRKGTGCLGGIYPASHEYGNGCGGGPADAHVAVNQHVLAVGASKLDDSLYILPLGAAWVARIDRVGKWQHEMVRVSEVGFRERGANCQDGGEVRSKCSRFLDAAHRRRNGNAVAGGC